MTTNRLERCSARRSVDRSVDSASRSGFVSIPSHCIESIRHESSAIQIGSSQPQMSYIFFYFVDCREVVERGRFGVAEKKMRCDRLRM